MKRIIALFLSLILLLSLFAACGEKEPERSYEKIAHEVETWLMPMSEFIPDESEVICKFPPVSGYDDVVLYAKQYYYMTHGEMNNNPYVVIKDDESGMWMFKSSVLEFSAGSDLTGKDTQYLFRRQDYAFVIESDGDAVYASPAGDTAVLSLPENAEFDLTNEFSFSYQSLSEYESLDMYIEKLDSVNCAEDVIERARYLRSRTYKTDTLNPYAVCYDAGSDCWLYFELEEMEEKPLMYFVIDSSGQLLLFTFYIPKLS